MTILHVINLDTIGGVEELFFHFLLEAGGNHALYITGSTIHSHFRKQIQSHVQAVVYEKYLFGMPIPKCLRIFVACKMLSRIPSCDTVILWNRIEAIEKLNALFPKQDIIYYEHGASWIAKGNTTVQPFFQRMSKIIANSYAAKAFMQLKWGITQHIDVLENPLRPDIQIGKPRRHVRAPVRLGYIGRLIPLKGTLLLIEAAHVLKKRGIPFSLTIAGAGEDAVVLKRRINFLEMQAECSLIGSVKDVSSFYESIDLLLVPSIREPLGLVALEASSQGVPVIATAVDGLVEAVTANETGILITPTLPVEQISVYGGSTRGLPDVVYDPLTKTLCNPQLVDPEKIAQAIIHLVTEPECYCKLSEGGIVKTKRRLRFAEYAFRLSQLYTL